MMKSFIMSSSTNYYLSLTKITAFTPLPLAPENPEKYKPPITKDGIGITDEEYELLKQSIGYKPYLKNILQKEEAIADVELAYRLLRYCYAGYSFFGGDQVFYEAKDELINKISLSNELTVGTFKEYLIESLSFINDGHFRIDHTFLAELSIFHHNKDIEFHKDDKGFFSYDKGKKRYITEIDGDANFDERLFLSLNLDGEFVYYVGKVDSDTKGELSCSIHFENESFDVVLYPPVPFTPGTDKPLETTISVVRINSFSKISNYDYFLGGAAIVRDSGVSIIDLRDNNGGHVKNLYEWLHTYNSTVFDNKATIPYGNFSLIMKTQDAYKLYLTYEKMPLEWFTNNGHSVLLDAEFDNLMRSISSLRFNNYETYTNSYKRIENDNVIVVLIDKNTVSAGEHFIANLINIDNVVFVGTNSRGGTVAASGLPFALPNSKINIYSSRQMTLLFNEALLNEGIGFYSDIWVTEDSLNRVIKMLGKYYMPS